MKLVIVESPSKSKTIAKYLGDDFVVRASVGHVRDLPKSNKKALDIEGGFIPHYEIVAKKEEVIADIATQAKKAAEIILASDPDREGEAIAWHIAQVLRERLGASVSRKIKRIAFHEITKDAVQEALQHPRDIDEHLKEAQEARRVLDRIVGYDLSGLVWKKVRYGLSAGRVQSPALRIIVEREREIGAFKPETYWNIHGTWHTPTGAPIQLACSVEPRDRGEVDRIIATSRTGSWNVVSVQESEQKRSPRAPFITSTLQQAASSRLGYSPSRTMGIAQKLYESGAITYMRTDSTNLGAQAVAQIVVVVKKQYGDQYVSPRTYTTKSKNAQEAHEAIRPTNFSKLSAGHTDEQKRLYRLIWQRAVASQMSDARVMRTKVVANVHDNSLPDFEANGSRILFDGWLKADPESSGEDAILPVCAQGETLELISIDPQEKQTTPPPRYTEAGLIKELEKRDIGRPSTYASICKTIEDRGYVEKEGRSLKPTDTGEVVSTFLEEYFPDYISDTFTAEMENKLDEIADGRRTYLKTLKDFYDPFHKDVMSKDKLAKATNLGLADPTFKCPLCGSSPMEIKLGKNGKFLSCARYPECEGALTIDGMEFKKDEPIGMDPTTGLPIFVLNGRFGPYVQLGLKQPKKKKGKKKKETTKTAAEATGEAVLVSTTKPKMASIPKTMDPMKVTVADALRYLSLPRTLGPDPTTGADIVANNGRFGPYVMRTSRDSTEETKPEYRSIKPPLDVYEITLEQALGLLAQEKKPRGFPRKKK